jgi:hypothetical protein
MSKMRATDVTIAAQSVVVGFLWRAQSRISMNFWVSALNTCARALLCCLRSSKLAAGRSTVVLCESLLTEWNRQYPIFTKVNADKTSCHYETRKLILVFINRMSYLCRAIFDIILGKANNYSRHPLHHAQIRQYR